MIIVSPLRSILVLASTLWVASGATSVASGQDTDAKSKTTDTAAEASSGQSSSALTPRSKPRGLVLITVDTLRADHVGAYGHPAARDLTPNIDRLAATGALIEHGATPTPTTGPAHASLFTGLHPWRHGVLDNAVPLQTEAGRTTLAEALGDAGFTTQAFVSSYVLNPRFGFDRGFDAYSFEPTLGYHWRGEVVKGFWARGDATSSAAMTWLANRANSDERFFLWVHYFDPHSPYAPPMEYKDPPDTRIEVSDKQLPPQVKSWGEMDGLLRAYRGEVRYVDSQIGRLLDRLQILGMADTTAVVLTSDHGEGLGDHGHLEHGRNLHRELIDIPLIVRAPGISSGRHLAGAAQLEDLYPTILSLLGVTTQPPGDGVDLTPWLTDQTQTPPRSTVYGRRKHYEGKTALYYRMQWPEKWIGDVATGGVSYQLDDDAGELAGTREPTAPEDLTHRLRSQASPTPAPQTLDEESRRALKALGYLE